MANYSLDLGGQIEGEIKEVCKKALEKITRADNSAEYAEQLAVISNALGRSKPDSGAELRWTADMLEAYRGLGNLVSSFKEFSAADSNKYHSGRDLGELSEFRERIQNL